MRALALAFTSEDAEAAKTLEDAAKLARTIGDKRGEGVALGLLGIVHQRAGRAAEAKRALRGGARRRARPRATRSTFAAIG